MPSGSRCHVISNRNRVIHDVEMNSGVGAQNHSAGQKHDKYILYVLTIQIREGHHIAAVCNVRRGR